MAGDRVAAAAVDQRRLLGAQIASAFQQRVRNRQPRGGATGLGTSPSRTMRLRAPLAGCGSGNGTADSSACVYGWLGRS